jgi:hypothetical protein
VLDVSWAGALAWRMLEREAKRLASILDRPLRVAVAAV